MEGESQPEKIAKAMICAWALWGNRNEVRMGGHRQSCGSSEQENSYTIGSGWSRS